MAITNERLITRLEELKTQLEHAKANCIAIQGAIADLNFLLSEDEQADNSKAKELKDGTKRTR